jgi:hypothetical protein
MLPVRFWIFGRVMLPPKGLITHPCSTPWPRGFHFQQERWSRTEAFAILGGGRAYHISSDGGGSEGEYTWLNFTYKDLRRHIQWRSYPSLGFKMRMWKALLEKPFF